MRTAIAKLLVRHNRDKTAADVEEELRFHVDMLEGKYAQHGMPAAEAKAAAARRFGNFERTRKQCVAISRRSSLPARLIKIVLIFIGLAGFSIRILSSDIAIDHIGGVLIMIAILGRLLLYVRGLVPATFFPRTNDTSLSVVTEHPKDSSKPREA